MCRLINAPILPQGIHKAAKKLENKAKAKEHRHIALLLTQRLGTQVGVSLMLHAQRQKELADAANKDSGYNTNTVWHRHTQTARTYIDMFSSPPPTILSTLCQR